MTLAAIPRAVSAKDVRAELAAALAGIAPANVSVWGAPVAKGVPPALVLTPGVPYVTPSPASFCTVEFRFVWWAVVGRLVVDALDELEALGELVSESCALVKGATYDGIPVGIQADQWGGVDIYAAQNELHVGR